jgi:hypothetical protein
VAIAAVHPSGFDNVHTFTHFTSNMRSCGSEDGVLPQVDVIEMAELIESGEPINWSDA